jgi:hypothetical protein
MMCNSVRHSGKKVFNVSVPLADSDQKEQVITREITCSVDKQT